MTPKEFPGHLSSLQFDFLRAFRGPAFFLTGGGALIGFYGHQRITRDLDLSRGTKMLSELGRTYSRTRRLELAGTLRLSEQHHIFVVFELAEPKNPPS